MILTIFPWKFTNKVLQLKDVPCFGLRFYNFPFIALSRRRVWGTAHPSKKLSQGAGNFQELKICGHGTILALTVRIIRLALVVIL